MNKGGMSLPPVRNSGGTVLKTTLFVYIYAVRAKLQKLAFLGLFFPSFINNYRSSKKQLHHQAEDLLFFF